MEKIDKLPGALLPWFEDNKRDLPWRQDREVKSCFSRPAWRLLKATIPDF